MRRVLHEFPEGTWCSAARHGPIASAIIAADRRDRSTNEMPERPANHLVGMDGRRAGTSRSSPFAALRLMTASQVVGGYTDKLAGFPISRTRWGQIVTRDDKNLQRMIITLDEAHTE